jgi:predicted membrane-bound spermidine synthase
MRRVWVHLLFAVSGATGLIYQVTWVRQFARVFGNTVHSAAVVTGLLLAGLGLGGWLAGAWADRNPTRGLRGYAVAEWVIAGLGLAVALVLPRMLPLSAAMSSYVQGPEGWFALSWGSHAGRLVLAALLLGPSALCMGATLTLLIRDQVQAVQEAGSRVGWLYGLNTVGAAAGALAADLWLLPMWGIWGTQLVAVGANLAVGGVAWTVAAKMQSSRVGWVGSGPSLGVDTAAPLGRTGLALLLAGVATMGMELTWFRFLAGSLGPYRAVFSVLLAVVLLGIAVGAAAGGWAHRRFGRPAQLFAVAQAAFVVSALGLLATYDPYALLERQHAVAAAYHEAGHWTRALLLHRLNASVILGLVFLPAVAMGASFPLGNALVQGASARVGRSAGTLYLATTSGNVLGSLAAGFWWLPTLGIQATALICAALAALAPLVLWRTRPIDLASLAASAVALAGFASLPGQHVLWSTFPFGRAQDEGVLEIREGLEQIVVVTGLEEGPARLWTSGHPMTSTSPHAQRYMRLMSHLPLLLQEDPKRALVICVGAGNTVHAASLHPSIELLHAVDLSRDVLSVNRWFEHSNAGVLRDPRTSVFVNDGRHHLLMQPEGYYDLVTLEPPPLAVAGVSALYSREFYALARSRLTESGMLAQWLPAYQVPEGAVRSLVAAFVEVFPDAILVVGSGRELVLLGGAGGVQMRQSQLGDRLAERTEVAADLARLGVLDATALVSIFAAGPDALARATAGAQAVTDDRPLLEHTQQSHLMATRLPADLFDPMDVGAWCGLCSEDPKALGRLRLWKQVFAGEQFLSFNSITPDRTSILDPPDTEDNTLGTIANSPALIRVFQVPDALALRASELWSQGRHDDARLHLRAARDQAPGVPLLDEMAVDMGLDPPQTGR